MLAVSATVGVALTMAIGVAAANGWNDNTWAAVAPRVGVIGTLFTVGIWSLARRPHDRFGRLLVALGVIYGVSMLNGSDSSLAYSIGRTVLPFGEVMVAYTALAFPSGRLTRRGDRLVISAFAAVVVLVWPVAVLASPDFGVGGVMVECGLSCPANAFAAGDAMSLSRALSDCVYLAGFLASLWVVASLLTRYRRGRPMQRRSLAPVTFGPPCARRRWWPT